MLFKPCEHVTCSLFSLLPCSGALFLSYVSFRESGLVCLGFCRTTRKLIVTIPIRDRLPRSLQGETLRSSVNTLRFQASFMLCNSPRRLHAKVLLLQLARMMQQQAQRACGQVGVARNCQERAPGWKAATTTLGLWDSGKNFLFPESV